MPFAGLLMVNQFGSNIGAIFALGVQKKAAPLYLFSQYIIALPLGIILAKTYGYGAKGIYMAQALASLSLNIVGSIWMQYISWEECAQRADERIKKEKQ